MPAVAANTIATPVVSPPRPTPFLHSHINIIFSTTIQSRCPNPYYLFSCHHLPTCILPAKCHVPKLPKHSQTFPKLYKTLQNFKTLYKPLHHFITNFHFCHNSYFNFLQPPSTPAKPLNFLYSITPTSQLQHDLTN